MSNTEQPKTLCHEDKWFDSNLRAILGGEVSLVETGKQSFINRERISNWIQRNVTTAPQPVQGVDAGWVSHEEVFDEFSESIGDDIYDLERFAGTVVITREAFNRLAKKYKFQSLAPVQSIKFNKEVLGEMQQSAFDELNPKQVPNLPAPVQEDKEEQWVSQLNRLWFQVNEDWAFEDFKKAYQEIFKPLQP